MNRRGFLGAVAGLVGLALIPKALRGAAPLASGGPVPSAGPMLWCGGFQIGDQIQIVGDCAIYRVTKVFPNGVNVETDRPLPTVRAGDRFVLRDDKTVAACRSRFDNRDAFSAFRTDEPALNRADRRAHARRS